MLQNNIGATVPGFGLFVLGVVKLGANGMVFTLL